MAFLKEKIELQIAEAQLTVRRSLSLLPAWERVVIIVCLLGFIPAYSIAKTISQRLTTQRNSRYHLTAHPAFTNAEAPEIINTTITTSRDNLYAVAVKIKNNNPDLALNQGAFTLHLYNNRKEEVSTQTGTVLMLPAETKFLVIPRIQSLSPITGYRLEFAENLPWQKRFSLPTVKLIASPATFRNQTDPVAFVVEGTIYNSSPYQVKETLINFVLYDTSGKVIAASQRREFDLAPFERRAYKQLWPGVYSQQVTKADILPETNVLDPANLTLPENLPSPASNLDRDNEQKGR